MANRLDYKEKFGYLFVGNKRIKLNKDDIKTRANKNDVQVGDRGYGAFWYYQYKQNMSDLITIKKIDEDEYGGINRRCELSVFYTFRNCGESLNVNWFIRLRDKLN